MITSAKFTEGFPLDLPALGKKKFEFSPGVNVVFGPNGCGKSTLLSFVAGYSGCGKEGGWSKAVEPAYLHGDGSNYPNAFAVNAPGRLRAKVVWDGTASFLYSATTSDAPMLAFGMPSDGLLDEFEKLGADKSGALSGQKRLLNLSRLFETAKTPPILTQSKKWKDLNSTWAEAEEKFVDYVKSLSRAGPPTLILDEPDRSLDLPNQREFWLTVMPRLEKKVQLIVATHSPFALFVKDAEIIDLEEGYAERARVALRSVL